MGEFSPTHWLILIAVVVLLFGSAKLPTLARSLGQSLRILRTETRELRDDHARPSHPDQGATSNAADATGPSGEPQDRSTG